jgi:prolipoprotein diacylglyceryltransferase
MTFPITLHLGTAAVQLHLIFELLAFFLGFRFFTWLRRQHSDPIAEPRRLWILLGATLGALVGSRLVGALENPEAWYQSPNPWVFLYQSKTIVGGLLGGLAGVEGIKKIMGERQSSGDLFTFPLILAMMIGRIGCFSMGVYEPTFGLPTSLPWAIDLGDGLSRHPTALYEIIFLGILWLVLMRIEQKTHLASGMRFKLFMIAYLSFRFCLEFIQPRYHWSLGMTTIQMACLLGLVYYALLLTRAVSASKTSQRKC